MGRGSNLRVRMRGIQEATFQEEGFQDADAAHSYLEDVTADGNGGKWSRKDNKEEKVDRRP